jgi:hypothetical protein
MMHGFANSAFPHAGLAFSDMHVVVAQVVAGNSRGAGGMRKGDR